MAVAAEGGARRHWLREGEGKREEGLDARELTRNSLAWPGAEGDDHGGRNRRGRRRQAADGNGGRAQIARDRASQQVGDSGGGRGRDGGPFPPVWFARGSSYRWRGPVAGGGDRERRARVRVLLERGEKQGRGRERQGSSTESWSLSAQGGPASRRRTAATAAWRQCCHCRHRGEDVFAKTPWLSFL